MNRRELLRTVAIFSASGTFVASAAHLIAEDTRAPALAETESLKALLTQSRQITDAMLRQLQRSSPRPLVLVAATQELAAMLQEADFRLTETASASLLHQSAAFWQACSDALLRTSAVLTAADSSGIRLSLLPDAQRLFSRTAGLFGEATKVATSQAGSGSFC